MQTPREIVTRCLEFDYPERLPRDLWVLPWATSHHPEAVAELERRFPPDIVTVDYTYTPNERMKGDPYKQGIYIDEWGCVFENIQDGIIGEIKDPILKDISDWKRLKLPYEQLPKNGSEAYDTIRRYYENTDKFVKANCCPRPWERYQFLRGTENAMMDIMMPDEGARDLLKCIHDFYLAEMEFWVKTDVDAVMFMDDWGAQNQLLVPPRVWNELFKPLYKDYCDLAHAHDKYIFMHSDGHISEIYEPLIDVGVNAVNSQLFCMDMADLEKRAKGKITFWGEIDRQHILPSENPEDGRNGVRKVASHLYDASGGIIAQFEFGAGANPETAIAIFEEWKEVEKQFKINS